MKYRLLITDAAIQDLEEIFDWIAEHDSPAKADALLDRILQVTESIAALPGRGSRPPELPADPSSGVRQVYFKPYRIIYEIDGSRIIVHLIADGRRNMQSLLLRRLLGTQQ